MRSIIGLGEPNHIQRWYAERNGSAYSYNFPWCDAAITWAAWKSGNHGAVCPNGDRAYTPTHANDFKKLGRWHSGTTANVNRCRPGDIVFYDWSGTNSISRVDHVGVVERVLGGGRIQTIEGNTSNQCLRRVRSAGVIAGYGRPAYSGGSGGSGGSGSSGSSWMENLMSDLPLLKRGDRGEHVETVQGLLLARSHPEVKIDGDFGPVTERAVQAVQSWGGVAADGEVGPRTWPVLLRVH
ncbi:MULTISPECIES: peptidoglycan-binding protein [unclassified Spirillospora]|uniref:peptidoglycan-binding protein n=1 Tax=unclassified Spirillospora TaxID=2642701 RepID=UPI00371209A5